MSTRPLTIIDDFFEKPHSLKNWALSVNYKTSSDSIFPGKRSSFLHELQQSNYTITFLDLLKHIRQLLQAKNYKQLPQLTCNFDLLSMISSQPSSRRIRG